MGRRPRAHWELRPRAGPTARSLVAATILAVAGAGVGGPVGWAAFVFFGVASAVLAVQLVGRARLAGFGPDGVTLASGRGGPCTIPWDDVAAIVLWTRVAPDGRPVDVLGVVTQPATTGCRPTQQPPPDGADAATSPAVSSAPSEPNEPIGPIGPIGPEGNPLVAPDAGGLAGTDPDRLVAAAMPLVDCRLDCRALRAALVGFSHGAALVDRRG